MSIKTISGFHMHRNYMIVTLIKLMPTIRIQNGDILDSDYSRTKFELTTEIKF